MKILYSFLIGLLCSLSLPAQIITEKIIGDEEFNEAGFRMLALPDGGYYVLGIQEKESNQDYDHYDASLSRMSKDHEIIWQKTYPQADFFPFSCSFDYPQKPYDFIQLQNGNLLLYISLSNCQEFSSPFLLEVNSDGELLSTTLIDRRFHHGIGHFKNGKLIQTLDGGFLITGYWAVNYNIGMGSVIFPFLYMIKFNENYEEEWRELNWPGVYAPTVMETSENTFFFLHGRSVREKTPDTATVYRFNDNALLQFSTTLKLDDGYISCGIDNRTLHYYYCGFDYSAAVVKHNEAFEVEWEKVYSAESFYNISQIQPIKNGYLIAGTAKPHDSCYYRHHQAFLAKIDLEGNVIWDHVFEAELSYFEDFIFYPDGRIVLIGAIEQNSQDVYIVEYKTNDRLPNFNLEGVEFQAQVFPNPARDFLKLKVETGINSTGQVSYAIYDVLGRIVMQGDFDFEYFVGEESIDIASLSTGVYFIEVTYQKETQVFSWIKQ